MNTLESAAKRAASEAVEERAQRKALLSSPRDKQEGFDFDNCCGFATATLLRT